VDKYFEGFPDMNFTYDAKVVPFLSVYERAGEMEKLKKELNVLVNNTIEELNFLNSLDDDIIKTSFRNDMAFASQAARDCVRFARATGDDAYFNKVNSALSPYMSQRVPN
jgi:hypothetical protein